MFFYSIRNICKNSFDNPISLDCFLLIKSNKYIFLVDQFISTYIFIQEGLLLFRFF